MDLQPGLKRAQMNQLAALLRKLVEGIDDPSQISSERKLLKLLPTTYGVCGMAIFSQASSVYGEECLPRRGCLVREGDVWSEGGLPKGREKAASPQLVRILLEYILVYYTFM